MNARSLLILILFAAACRGNAPPPSQPTLVDPPVASAAVITRLPPPAYVVERDRVLAEARAVLTLLAAGDGEALFARFNADMAAAVPREQVVPMVRSLKLSGGITTLANERAVPISRRVRTYVADATIEGNVLALAIAFDERWQLAGIQFGPLLETPPPGPGTAVVLPLPADGTWLVFWGGDDPRDNYHVLTPSQRHAYDLVVWEDGSTFRGEGTRNEDYFCFGRPIVAPADAKVVEVVSGLPDNTPGQMDPAHAAGNHVMLELAAGRYLLLAHMQAGSVVLREGDQVRRGATVGKCGNSGNTSEPHLHLHLQDRPVFGDPEARGLPLQFGDVIVDGARLPTAAPVRGRFLTRAP